MNVVAEACLPLPDRADLPRVPAGRLWSPADLLDPYPLYAELRAAGPIHWSDTLFGGAWIVSRQEEAEQVLRDTRFSAQRTGGWVMGGDRAVEALSDVALQDESAPAAGTAPRARTELTPLQRLMARAFLFVDAPDHGRLRGLLHAGFTPSGLAALRPWLVARIETLLDALQGEQMRQPDQPVDLIAHLARLLPASVIARVLGLPPGDEARVMAWSDEIAVFIGEPVPDAQTARRAQRGMLQMAAFLEREFAARRAAGTYGEGLLGRLLQAQDEGLISDAHELMAQAVMLLFAGHETTRYLLGNLVQTLLAHPDQWQRLLAEPELIPGAVREVLRVECPVQYTGRRVAVAHEFCGQPLQRGDAVIVLIGAANRDDARFIEPERFDITRRGRASLAFGTGAHVCIGASLSLMEAELVLAALLRRWPGLRLADAAPAWQGNPLYRGLRRLPVWLGESGCSGAATT
ncbi:MAG: cytochrome P450, partial [Leptothrix sp. (in: b-proteobacteria)]